jgi:hypothetical protein
MNSKKRDSGREREYESLPAAAIESGTVKKAKRTRIETV